MTKRLTWEQKCIVNHDTGHALIKAVPGSGKTTTLVKRVERLIKSGAAPHSILILMYNKSAQLSFKSKLQQALKSSSVPEVRTFHSLALKIVSYAEQHQIIKKRKLLTPDNPQYEKIVKEAYCCGFEHEASYIDPNDIEEFELFITRCRAAGITPTDAETDPIFSEEKKELILAYGHYCDLLTANNSRTFDDCLIEATLLLRDNPNLAAHFKHVIVDEYQDVNLIQHNMVRYLSRSDTSVMAVGDINQCIYEWRGARPDFIGGLFERHFESTKVFQLSCTFRFGHQLSLMANSVIRRNSTKLSRLCVSHPSAPKTEAKMYVDNCLSTVLKDLSHSNGTQAILSRTKASLAEAEVALRLCGLPYKYHSGASSLHTRTEIGMLVVGIMWSIYGDLRLLEGHPHKQPLLYGFLRETGLRWKKGQLKAALNTLMAPSSDSISVIRTIFDSDTLQSDYANRLVQVSQKDSEESLAIDVVLRLKVMGILDGLGIESVSRAGSNDRQRGVVKIEELLESSKISAYRFLSLILNPEEASTNCEPFILSTLHASKGLEWDNVVLIGLNEEEYPGGRPDGINNLIAFTDKCATNEDIEEERRLFYVGMTRTKQQLNIVVPQDNGLSRWLENCWDSTPKSSPIATRFVYEAGFSACLKTSDSIYNNEAENEKLELSKFHQWYIRALQRLKV
ncbi:DNA helicase [Vibrio splendidus]|nr:DNA helicase [Vibrio splendidus]